jgi:hypothetical protein
VLHDLQGLGSLTKIWRSLSDTWDTVQAIRAKFTKSGYTTEELNGFINGEIKVPSLINHA